MNTLWGILNHPLTHRIGWTLLHSLWQGALVGAVFALLRLALRNRSANARYVAGCLSLGVLVAFPVLTLLLGAMPSAAFGSGPLVVSTFTGGALPSSSPGGPQSSYTTIGADSFWHQGTDFLGQVAPLLAAAWLLGVAFSSARLARSCWWVRNIRIRGNEPLEAAWMQTLNELRHRLGVSRPVSLLNSALVEVPTVIGWFRPVILLPVVTLSGLTPSQVEALLAHELAHVRRLDYVVNAFQCLVETLMFYHPVAWWISRYIREERENCCDDLVIQVCGDRLAYARALATMEGLRAELPDLVFAASGGSLLNRIRRLLGVSNANGFGSARQVVSQSLLGIGLALTVLSVCLTPLILSREPAYQGKGLAWWVRQMNEGDADARAAAVAVIRAMDSRAVPALIARLAPRDGRLRESFMWIDRHLPSTHLKLRDRYISVEAERGYAANALGAIGQAAEAAIPALIVASMNTNSFCAAKAKAALIQIRYDLTESLALPPAETRNLTNWLQRAEILLALGSNVQASADSMVATIGENTAERFNILEALGRNNREPNASVLLLRGLLKDDNFGVRANAINMLIMQRTFAKPARKEILQRANDSDAGVRANATYALLFAFPEQAASGGPKATSSTQPQVSHRK